jgi:hypothetical protein
MMLTEKLFSQTKKVQESQKQEYLTVLKQSLTLLLSDKNDTKDLRKEQWYSHNVQ